MKSPNLLLAMTLTAMAAGMGWGIRGQYGHESGAMIAGSLASLAIRGAILQRGSFADDLVPAKKLPSQPPNCRLGFMNIGLDSG